MQFWKTHTSNTRNDLVLNHFAPGTRVLARPKGPVNLFRAQQGNLSKIHLTEHYSRVKFSYMNIKRAIQGALKKDLKARKIILLGGPRQVGKTTLAKSLMPAKDSLYLNWDVLADRAIIRKHEIPSNINFLVLDEIHKYARWRMLLKGLYDLFHHRLSIVVTGSARLDHYRKGGDSLFGRSYYHRLHPLTLPELISQQTSPFEQLFNRGGFPEPLKFKDQIDVQRWRRERIAKVVLQDIQDLTRVKEISLMELLVDQLPSRVGSPLSIKSLQEDLEVSPNTVSSWINVLESVYYCYRISSYFGPKMRAVKKAQKLYLWDWSEVVGKGERLENMIASHLLKLCHHLEDTQGHRMELRYIRDVEHREIDFVVLKNRQPLFALECKWGEANLSPAIKYFATRLPIPKFYQVHLGAKDYQENFQGKILRILPFSVFCKEENLV